MEKMDLKACVRSVRDFPNAVSYTHLTLTTIAIV